MISTSLFCPSEQQFGVKPGKATQITQGEVGQTCNTHVRSGKNPLICVYPELEHSLDEQDIYECLPSPLVLCMKPVTAHNGDVRRMQEMLSNEKGIGFR